MLNDGMLDVLGVVDVDITQFGQVFSELNPMTQPNDQFVGFSRLPAFHIESATPMQMNLDGEPIQSTTFAFSVIPQA